MLLNLFSIMPSQSHHFTAHMRIFHAEFFLHAARAMEKKHDLLGWQEFSKKLLDGFLMALNAGLAVAQSENFKKWLKKYVKRFGQLCGLLYVVSVILFIPTWILCGLVDVVARTSLAAGLPGPFWWVASMSNSLGPMLLLAMSYRDDGLTEVLLSGVAAGRGSAPPPPPVHSSLGLGGGSGTTTRRNVTQGVGDRYLMTVPPGAWGDCPWGQGCGFWR